MAETETINTTETTGASYTPSFSEKVRTVVYVACLVASVIGLGFVSFGDESVGAFVSTAAGIIAAGTGTAYNPISLGRRS